MQESVSKITVIVPCYNASSYVDRCIKSLSSQTFKNFSCIFVDDCSADNTYSVVSDLLVRYGLKGAVLRNEQNKGPSYSRKVGIMHADSEYVAFCDSDDWYDPEFLSQMIDGTEGDRHDIVFSNYKLVYDDGKVIEKNMIGDWISESKKEDLVTINVDGLCGGIFRRSLFSGMDFPDIRNGEDMALIPVLISRACSVGFANKYLYNYFQRCGSLSQAQTDRMLDSLKRSFDYIEKNLVGNYYEQIEYLGVRNLLYGYTLNLFKRAYLPREARKLLLDFENKYPNWIDNKYCRRMPFYKRVFVRALRTRMLFVAYAMAKIHTVLISKANG